MSTNVTTLSCSISHLEQNLEIYLKQFNMVIVISDMIKKITLCSPKKGYYHTALQQMKSSLIRAANTKKWDSLQNLKQRQK